MMQWYQFLLLIAAFAAGCDYPTHYWSAPPACVSEAPASAATLSDVYQSGVRARLVGTRPSDYRYFFRSFDRAAEPIKIVVNFRNARDCFDVLMYVPEPGPLAGMYANGPESYPEELYEVTWRIAVVDGVDQVVFEDMHPIVD